MTLTSVLWNAARRARDALFAAAHWSAWTELRRLPSEFSARDVLEEDEPVQTRAGMAVEIIALAVVGIGAPVLIGWGLYLSAAAVLRDVDSWVLRHSAVMASAIGTIAYITACLDAMRRALRIAAFSSLVGLVALVAVTAWPELLATEDFRRADYVTLPLVIGISFGMLVHRRLVTTSGSSPRVAVTESVLVTALACFYGWVTYTASQWLVDLVGSKVTIGVIGTLVVGVPWFAGLLTLPNSAQQTVSVKRALKGNAPVTGLIAALAAGTIAVTSHAEDQHRAVDPSTPIYGVWIGVLAGTLVTIVFLAIRNLIAPLLAHDLPRRVVPAVAGLTVWALLSAIGFHNLNHDEYFTMLISAAVGIAVGWVAERRLFAPTASIKSG